MPLLDLFSDAGDLDADDFTGAELPSSAPVSPAPPPLPSPSAGPTCEVCGMEIPWSGRGRKPKRCQDHKTRTGDGGPTITVSPRQVTRGKGLQARLDLITGDLQEGAGKFAGVIAPVAPVTAGVTALKAPGAIAAIVRVSADYPRFLDGLEAAAKMVPFVEIGQFVVALIVAISVDLGRANPYSAAGRWLGVAEAAHEVGWTPKEDQQEQAMAGDWMIPPPPKRFEVK